MARDRFITWSNCTNGSIWLTKSPPSRLPKRKRRWLSTSDKKHRPLQFKKGDRVLLSAEHIKLPSTLGSYKFNAKYLGPFTVKKCVSQVSYELDIPPLWKNHPVFHVSKLREFSLSDKKWGERSMITDPVNLAGKKDYEVEVIVDEGIDNKGKKHYLIKWKGYDNANNSWTLASKLKDCDDIIAKWAKAKLHRSQLKQAAQKDKNKHEVSSRTMEHFSAGDC
jgi:hypothetical protein